MTELSQKALLLETLPVPGVDCPKKTCKKCNAPMTTRRDNATKKGWSWQCKPCRSVANKAKYHADPVHRAKLLEGSRARHQGKYHNDDPEVREKFRKGMRNRSTESKRRMYKDPVRHAANLETQRAWQQRAGNQRNAKLKHTYGITLAQYDQILEKQNDCCAICGTDNPSSNQYGQISFHVDHCHSTGEVRGLLCDVCNRGLGYFKDDTARLAEAIAYLNGNNRSLVAAVLHAADERVADGGVSDSSSDADT